MEIKNLYIDMHVVGDNWGRGDWGAALDEAKFLVTEYKLPVPIRVIYANQKSWIVTKDTDINLYKSERVVIGV